jgi:ABC-2 type transport system ATP-binding protein
MSLVIQQISKSFAPVKALDGVSFTVEPGRIFGLLGANGAGKTTCMRIVLDILRPDAGSVTWQGTSNTNLPRRTWGYLPEERGLYLRMKVIDVLRFFAALYGVPEAEATAEVEDWLERFRVPEYRDRKVEELSKGNQQKIQFIAAILHDPQVLIMDEPFSGLDPVNVQLLKEAFLEMRDRGKTLIFSTHQMEQVEELCEAIAIIDRGRVVESGPLREVKRRMGRQVVRLAVEQTDGAAASARPAMDAERGNGLGWVEEIPGVTLTRRGQDYLEMHVASGTDPESILQAVLARGERVTRFEIADPSLEEIFIERVGHRAIEEERHLAGGRHDQDASATEPAPEEVTTP